MAYEAAASFQSKRQRHLTYGFTTEWNKIYIILKSSCNCSQRCTFCFTLARRRCDMCETWTCVISNLQWLGSVTHGDPVTESPTTQPSTRRPCELGRPIDCVPQRIVSSSDRRAPNEVRRRNTTACLPSSFYFLSLTLPQMLFQTFFLPSFISFLTSTSFGILLFHLWHVTSPFRFQSKV